MILLPYVPDRHFYDREIQLATAFMTGKFELEGDVTKVMSLEGILKATRPTKKGSA